MKHARRVRSKPAGALGPPGGTPYLIPLNLYSGFIRSLSDFKRNTSELLERLKKTGNPLVLAINGKAEIVVQDAEAYQELLQRVETIEGIPRGLADVKNPAAGVNALPSR